MAATTSQSAEHHAHEAPLDSLFWKVGGVLAALTAIEVSTIWWPEGRLTSAALIVMMVVKFAIVGAYFMHLKWDPKILQRFLIGGIVLALFVYFAAMASMVIFDNSGVVEFNDAPRVRQLPPPATDPPAVPAVTAHHG